MLLRDLFCSNISGVCGTGVLTFVTIMWTAWIGWLPSKVMFLISNGMNGMNMQCGWMKQINLTWTRSLQSFIFLKQGHRARRINSSTKGKITKWCILRFTRALEFKRNKDRCYAFWTSQNALFRRMMWWHIQSRPRSIRLLDIDWIESCLLRPSTP